MSGRTPLPKGLDTEAFSIAEGAAAGLTRGRMRRPDLVTPFTGIRRRADIPTPELPGDRVIARAQAYAPRLLRDQFFSELTAVAIHGLPIPEAFSRETVVHIGVDYPARSPRARGMLGHQYRGSLAIAKGGLPVATPLSAWAQCAARLSIDELVVVGDGLVCRKSPLASLAEVHAAAADHRGRGAVRLRDAACLVRARTDSPRETMIRLILVHAGLPEPVVNYPVINRHGAASALVDMAYPGFHIAIEYDGRQHFEDELQHHLDVDRLDRIMEEHWRVIRFNRSHVRQGQRIIVARVETALRDRGWLP